MLDNVELIMNMKFQKLLMTGCRHTDTKTSKYIGVSPNCDPKDSFQKLGSVTLVPVWCPKFMQKIKRLIDSLRDI